MIVRRLVSVMPALALALGLIPGPAQAARAGAQAEASWTFMVYLAGDNNLEASALRDFEEMESVGATGAVNVVAQIDRAEGFDDSQGDWTEARRYEVQRDQDDDTLGSRLVASLGEVNMGSEDTLAEFLIWAVTTYPAQRYALVLWDHGNGWLGIAFDESSGGDGLSIPEIARALARMQAQTGVSALDVIVFDACLMGQIEVFLSLAPYGQVGVASPELVPGNGFDYAAVLDALTAAPDMDAAQLGQVIVDTFMDFYQHIDTDNPAFVLTAVDLSRADTVAQALSELVGAVQANPDAVLSHIGDARTNALVYTEYYLADAEVESTAAVDLGDLMSRLADVTSVDAVADAAQTVVDSVDTLVYHERHSDTLIGSSGVAVYFPHTPDYFEEAGDEYETQLAGDVRWPNFLDLYYDAATDLLVEAPQLFITDLSQDTVSIHEPTQFSIDLTGRDIAQVEFVLNYEMEDGWYVLLDRDTIITWEEVDGELVAVNSWEDGLNSFAFPWEGETPIVSDGQTETYALLVPSGETLDVAVGQGRYAPAGSEAWIAATLVFDIDTRQATAVYGISDTPGNPPFEIEPQPGDRFQFDWVYVNEDGSISAQPGETLVFGEEPFYYDYVPAPSGAYRMGFIAEDIAGNSAYRWVDLTVDNEGLDASQRGYTDWDFGFHFLYPASWAEPSWDSEDEVLYSSAEDADINFTIYPLADARSNREAAAALQSEWDVDVHVLGKREAAIGDASALVVRYEYEGQEGTRQGVYATFYQPFLDMAFGFDVDAAPEDIDAAAAALDAMLGSLRLFDPKSVAGADAWTVDVNQALGYALPARPEWLPAQLDANGWMIYRPSDAGAQAFAAIRADLSEELDNEAMAEQWLDALRGLKDHLNVQVTGRREYYIGDESWYAIGFTYTWAAHNAPAKGAFFVTRRGDVSYVLWIEAPEAEYEAAYADTFSVMIDGFAFLSGAQPSLALPTSGGPLRQVYTASGDSFRPEKLSPTATFRADDDINVVFVTDVDAEVNVIFVQPDGARREMGATQAQAGVSQLSGLDWEVDQEAWPAGQWAAEIYVDGEWVLTLTFTVEGEAGDSGEALDSAGGLLREAYTAAGDGMLPDELVPTTVFAPDDDINLVVTAESGTEVRAVFLLPGDLSGEVGPAALAPGESQVLGLDWEAYGEPWPAGPGSVEVYIEGRLYTTLAFEIGE